MATASLGLGQAISLLITGTGIFSTLLADKGVSVPATQSSLNYLLLFGHLIWAGPRIRAEGLAVAGWRYLLWALADVEANYLVVWAYKYTSIKSVMLLDCFAIPLTMTLSRCFLSARYTCGHVVASIICVTGLVLTVLSDLATGYNSSGSQENPLLGDLLVLAGASLYGFSNVQQETLLKSGCSRVEALGMLGLWGSVVSCVQAVALEREELVRVSWSPASVGYMLGFQLCLFSMYVLTSLFLTKADATFFNLSLLTSDVYSVLFAWLVQHQPLTWLYGAAFATTVSGLTLYYLQPAPDALASAAAPSGVDGLLEVQGSNLL